MLLDRMKPDINAITLGVSDLERSVAFYRDGLSRGDPYRVHGQSACAPTVGPLRHCGGRSPTIRRRPMSDNPTSASRLDRLPHPYRSTMTIRPRRRYETLITRLFRDSGRLKQCRGDGDTQRGPSCDSRRMPMHGAERGRDSGPDPSSEGGG